MALLVEKFDQLRETGDMLPQARSADGESNNKYSYKDIVVVMPSHRISRDADCFIDIYPCGSCCPRVARTRTVVIAALCAL